MTEEQIIIENDGGRLYGMLHVPDHTVEPLGSIVFCNPLFEERKSSHRVLVEAARAMCRDGCSVLRFDYRGCGDSSGNFNDFTPSDWLADIKAASAFMKQRTVEGPVALLGLRLGSALALKTAVNDPETDFVVLWEPVVNGHDYIQEELRKKLMKQMMTFGRSRETRTSLMKSLEDGMEIDFDGYPVSPALYKELCGINLLEAANGFRKHVLLVHVAHQDQPSKPISHLRDALIAADSMIEFRIVKEQPFWNLIGYVDCSSLIMETKDWLKKSFSR